MTGTKSISTKIRHQMKTPVQEGLSNQSQVYEAFADNEKLTITEVFERLNQNLSDATPKVSDRTIRRAIAALVKSGFLKPYGKQNNAMLYGKLSAAFTDADQKLINFGGELVSVEEFLREVVEPENNPLQKSKADLLNDEIKHHIRRRLAFVVITAGNVGFQDELKKVSRDLHGILGELQFVTNLLQNFMDSPVWYEQYRDKVGYGVRAMQQSDPDLYQLAMEYVRGK